MTAKGLTNSPGFILIKSRCHFREHAVLTGLTQMSVGDIYSLLWWSESVERFQATLDEEADPDPVPRPCSLEKHGRYLRYWALLSLSCAQAAVPTNSPNPAQIISKKSRLPGVSWVGLQWNRILIPVIHPFSFQLSKARFWLLHCRERKKTV